MRIQLSVAVLACAALTFAGGTFTSGLGSGSGTIGQAKVYSVPTGTRLGQYNITMGKGGVSAQSGPATIYKNLTTSTYAYVPGNKGIPLPMDDLHMVSGGNVNGYSFVYYDPSGNTALTQVEVAFFDNAASDPAPGFGNGLLYDTVLGGLPGDGLWQVNVDLGTNTFAAGPDVWMGIAFGGTYSNSTEAGWETYDPPTIGSSHDLLFEYSSYSYFGPNVNPPLNFGAAVYATPEPGTVAAILTGLVGLVGLRRRAKA